jgi:hypothetical protein
MESARSGRSWLAARCWLRVCGRRRFRFPQPPAKVLGPASSNGEQPNLDFALAAPSRVLRLPPESRLALFTVGRSIGLVEHALEQYATNQLIRPRGKYFGFAPAL